MNLEKILRAVIENTGGVKFQALFPNRKVTQKKKDYFLRLHI